MIRIVDNPYSSPSTQDPEVGQRGGPVFSSHAMRFATLGLLTGIGFGFVILALTARSTFERSSPGDATFTSSFAMPLLAFAFWSITTGAFLGVVGGAIGFAVDLARPIQNTQADEPSDRPELPVSRELES